MKFFTAKISMDKLSPPPFIF